MLRGFGFTMVVGIIVGTYSTIYIASPDRGVVGQLPEAAAAADGAGRPLARTKRGRMARVLLLRLPAAPL